MNVSFLRQWFNGPVASRQESNEVRAERGDVEAQFTLGLKFATAQGPARDYAQAVRWFLKAAEQGHVSAQFHLAVMYAEAKGVPRDREQSLFWLGRAANLCHSAAQYRLGIMHHRASLERFPVNASESRIQAYKWLQLSDDQGYRDADMARGLVNLQMSHAEVAEGNRRVADFVESQPGPIPKAAL